MTGYAFENCERCGGLVRSPHWCDYKGLSHIEVVRPVDKPETPVVEGREWLEIMERHSAQARAREVERRRSGTSRG